MLLLGSFSMATEKVTLGYFDKRPLMYKDEAGHPTGFLVDLVKAIDAQDDSIHVTFKHGSLMEQKKFLESNDVDMVLGLNESADERMIFNESSLILTWGTLVSEKSQNNQSILDLNGKSVGVVHGDDYFYGSDGLKEKLNDFNISADIYGFDTYKEVLNAIEEGLIDVGVIDHLSINEIYHYKNIKATDLLFNAKPLKIAYKNQNMIETVDKIDDYIFNWRNDRESIYYETYHSYFDRTFIEQWIPFYRSHKTEIYLGVLWAFLMILYARLELHFKTKTLVKAGKALKTAKKINEETLERKKSIVKKQRQALVDLEGQLEKFESLVTFVRKNLAVQHAHSERELFSEILREAVALIPEADYGYAYKFNEQDQIEFIESVNTKMPYMPPIHKDHLYPLSEGSEIIDGFLTKVIEYPIDYQIKAQLRNSIPFSKQTLTLVLENNGRIYGGLLLEIKEGSEKTFKERSKNIMIALKNIAEGYFLNENYHNMGIIFQREMIFALIKLLEIHDIYTKGHSFNVAKESKKLAYALELPEKQIEEIYWAGLVHDIGKILINRRVINKKGQLSTNEYDRIKLHPVYGYDALKHSALTNKLGQIILHHHEFYNGNGYPEGLSGEDIPLASRIICIADSFDAMTSNRAYRQKMTLSRALREIKMCLGSQFDPQIGQTFIELKKKEDEIHEKTNDERYRQRSRGI